MYLYIVYINLANETIYIKSILSTQKHPLHSSLDPEFIQTGNLNKLRSRLIGTLGKLLKNDRTLTHLMKFITEISHNG